MKKNRKNINVYQLTHTYSDDEEEVFIKTDMPELELVKLIKVIQLKTYSIEETFDLFPQEMRDVLLQYNGIRAYPNDEDIEELELKGEDGFDYIEIDLYNVWEASNVKVSDEELNSDKYNNDIAIRMIEDYIREELG